jgi:hypothetical protein
MAIPFRSLRFKPDAVQQWGVYFGRWIPRTGEWSFWPAISSRQQSYLAQMARLEGIRDVSRGRGVQAIPYVSSRAFKAPVDAGSSPAASVRDHLDPGIGLDVKAVLRGALVLDATVNPDFSQVESDAPQITANQRFELFFPEKRPFFLENAGFFQTPVNLLFTRRIADPQIGAKLTGKVGAWTVGLLAADDEAPGKRASAPDPASGARAWAGLARASRSLAGRSTMGAIVSRRAFHGRDNVVAGIDGRFRMGRVWSAEGQYAASRLVPGDGTPTRSGAAYLLALSRNGRTVTSRTEVDGRSPGFVTDLGFVPRVDAHEASQTITYTLRPAKTLTDWGPTLLLERIWSHEGAPLDWRARPSVTFNFVRSTSFGGFFEPSGVTLRPGDAANVERDLAMRPDTWGVNASTSPRPAWSVSLDVTRGAAVNFQPARGTAPALGDHASARLTFAVRPLTPLRIENTWLRTSLDTEAGRAFATDIVRSQWAWQFTREWSLRLIAQYESTRANPALSSLAPGRNLNADVLLTRLVNPWTAIYAGYNGNARGLALDEPGRAGFPVRIGPLASDAWQVFVKWSHLLQW